MRHWLEPLAGGVVLLVTLLDVFLTVLYARASTGLLAPRLARACGACSAGSPADVARASSATAAPCSSSRCPED